jgi:hypothetical protein
MSGADDWARGIDVSWANRTTPTLTGRDFAFVRACYGTRVDAKWAYHSANVRKAGAVLGAYAFGIYGDGAAQAAAFLAIAGKADLLALDLERESGKPEMTTAQARAFIVAVQGTGREIGLYHSDSAFPALGQNWNWVARWGTTPPTRTWVFWQHRGSPLDLDYYHGDAAALYRFATVRGGSEMINAAGNDLRSAKVARITADTPLLDAPGGTKIATAKVGYGYPFVGVVSGYRAVLVETALPYPDAVKRPTVLYLAASAVSLEDAPEPPTPNSATVTLQITGHPDHVTQV